MSQNKVKSSLARTNGAYYLLIAKARLNIKAIGGDSSVFYSGVDYIAAVLSVQFFSVLRTTRRWAIFQKGPK